MAEVLRWALQALGLAAMAGMLAVAFFADTDRPRRDVARIAACFALALACFQIAGRFR